MTETEKYRYILLTCERTFENIGKIIKNLKSAAPDDLPKLILAIEIDTDHIRKVIIENLEP